MVSAEALQKQANANRRAIVDMIHIANAGHPGGSLSVIDILTAIYATDVDLHAYVVGNDGRAYTAISHIPQPAAQALLPLTPIGGLFGWLFALEKPGWENGFSLTGEQGRGHHCFGGLGFHPVEEDSLAPEPHGWACSVQGSGGWFGLAGLFLRPCDSF